MVTPTRRRKSKGSPTLISEERGVILLGDSLTREHSPADLLSRLSRPQRERIVAAGKRLSYAAGATLFHQGARHNGLYIIEAGVIRSYYVSDTGREITLAYWPRGHFVGGPQIYNGGTNFWTSEAATDATCLWLPADKLKTLTRDIPELALAVIDGLVHKASCYCALLQLLATRSMQTRLMKLLLMLSADSASPKHAGSKHPWCRLAALPSHRQLASMIGSTRQWVSATLAKLERQGALRYQPNGDVLVDRRLLEPARDPGA